MTVSKRLFIISIIQFLIMVLFISLLKEDTQIFNFFSLGINGSRSKWFELIYAFIPLIITSTYLIECYYLTKREMIKGTPYNNKKIMMWISEILFMIISLLVWVRLIMQRIYIYQSEIRIPWFFILGFILSLLIIIAGQLLARALKGDCLGIHFPFITKDHSIWRRVNVLIGELLIISGIILILSLIVYEIILNPIVVVVGVVLILLFSFVIPVLYGIYLAHKSNKKY